MLNAAKPLPSVGDLLSSGEDICNALFVVPVLVFRFLAHDPIKTLILILAWWYRAVCLNTYTIPVVFEYFRYYKTVATFN